MAKAKRYVVSVNHVPIYTGPIRSAQLVYDSIMQVISLVCTDTKPLVIFAFDI